MRHVTHLLLCAAWIAGSAACSERPNLDQTVNEARPSVSSDTTVAHRAPTPEKSDRQVPGPEVRAKLVSWWLRHDQSYMMILDAIAEDGQVEARYLNPAPIHVSDARIWSEDGVVRLRLELTDQNYPGNYYELAYQTDSDMWIGLYHHLGNGQTYEVYFTRFEDSGE